MQGGLITLATPTQLSVEKLLRSTFLGVAVMLYKVVLPFESSDQIPKCSGSSTLCKMGAELNKGRRKVK